MNNDKAEEKIDPLFIEPMFLDAMKNPTREIFEQLENQFNNDDLKKAAQTRQENGYTLLHHAILSYQEALDKQNKEKAFLILGLTEFLLRHSANIHNHTYCDFYRPPQDASVPKASTFSNAFNKAKGIGSTIGSFLNSSFTDSADIKSSVNAVQTPLTFAMTMSDNNVMMAKLLQYEKTPSDALCAALKQFPGKANNEIKKLLKIPEILQAIHSPSTSQEYPLFLAARLQDTQAFSTLIDQYYGAHKTTEQKSEQFDLSQLIDPKTGNTVLHETLHHEPTKSDKVAEDSVFFDSLLKLNGIENTLTLANKAGFTPLTLAARLNRPSLTNRLLQLVAEHHPDKLATELNAALSQATQFNHERIVERLIVQTSKETLNEVLNIAPLSPYETALQREYSTDASGRRSESVTAPAQANQRILLHFALVVSRDALPNYVTERMGKTYAAIQASQHNAPKAALGALLTQLSKDLTSTHHTYQSAAAREKPALLERTTKMLGLYYGLEQMAKSFSEPTPAKRKQAFERAVTFCTPKLYNDESTYHFLVTGALWGLAAGSALALIILVVASGGFTAGMVAAFTSNAGITLSCLGAGGGLIAGGIYGYNYPRESAKQRFFEIPGTAPNTEATDNPQRSRSNNAY